MSKEDDMPSLLDSSPTKKEQSLKEQLEQDWAEDDSQDPTDAQKDSTQDLPNPNIDTTSLDHTDDIATSMANFTAEPQSTDNSMSAFGMESTNVETTTADEASVDVPSTSVANVSDILSSGMPVPDFNALESALDDIDSNTEAAIDNIIDSALAAATEKKEPVQKSASNSDTEQPKEAGEAPQTAAEPETEAEEAKGEKEGEDGEEPEKEKGKEGEDKAGKKMRMHLTSQMMQKLLKEGNMEKLPNGAYKIKAEALKELQNNMNKDEDDEEESDEDEEGEEGDQEDEEEEEEQDQEDEDEEEEKEKQKPIMVGKPKPDAEKTDENLETSAMDTSDMLDMSQSQSQKEDEEPKDAEETTKIESKKREAPEDQKDVGAPKKKKSKYDQDYVSDYNSSEDDEDSAFSLMRENIKSMMPRKAKYQSKGISFLEEVHRHLFPDEDSDDTLSELSDSDSEQTKSNYSKANGLSPSKSKNKLCPGTSSIEAKLGIDGDTTLKVVATGEIKEVQGKEFEVYHICTTPDGSSTTTTPLMVPRSSTQKGGPVKKKKPTGAVMLYHKPHVKHDPDDPNLLEEVEEKRVKLRKYKQQLKLLRLRYLQLVQERMSNPGFHTLADLVSVASKFLTDEQLIFTTMQLKSGCINTQGMRWSPREKILALGIYQQNPSQYDFLRQLFHLPNKNVLERWLECIAKNNPVHAKKLMYHVYTKYAYKAAPKVAT